MKEMKNSGIEWFPHIPIDWKTASRGKVSPVLNVLETEQNKRYIMYFLRSMTYSDVFLALATGTHIRSCNLRWNNPAELFYPVLPFDEQEAIVAYIDSVLQKTDDVITDKKEQLSTLNAYKKSPIYEYVTGEKGDVFVMKVEYTTSSLGIGTELHISAAEYKRVNSEAGWSEHSNLMFAVRAYVRENQCTNIIKNRDLEEASRHIKKVGTIALVAKTNGEVVWCEVYAITEGKIIPVITSEDGHEFVTNYSSKTIHQMNRNRQEREVNPDE